jgi:putative DNA primase/helicase
MVSRVLELACDRLAPARRLARFGADAVTIPQFMRAAEIHARLSTRWPEVLQRVGVAENFLQLKKAGPCPGCGGRDRYTFDNRSGRGDFLCRQCGAGDGFELLKRVFGWDFREARRRVLEAADLSAEAIPMSSELTERPDRQAKLMAKPTNRVREVLRGACEPGDVADVRAYLGSRKLWPLPERCSLRAHATLEYWHERRLVGRFPGVVAPVRDVAGELVTLHLTYLANGRKLTDYEPRKILSPMNGRDGVAAQLLPIDADVLGIAEGIETAIAAHVVHKIPVWAALNTSLLAKFEPAPTIRTLIIFADRDTAGLEAAVKLMERLQCRVHVELCVPRAPAKDWADVLVGRAG